MFAAISVQQLNTLESIALVHTPLAPELDVIDSIGGEEAVTPTLATDTEREDIEAPTLTLPHNLIGIEQLEANLVHVFQSHQELLRQLQVLKRCTGCTLLISLITLIGGTTVFILTLLLIWHYLE